MPSKSRLFTEEQFSLVQRLCAAPSPVGFESAMVDGVILPELEAFKPEHWQVHRFAANAGAVIDTNPDADDALTIMPIGHADKIRLQVRSIGRDGKIWVDSDSFLPASIIGHRFNLFVETGHEGMYHVLSNLTAQAFGAAHFVDADVRVGRKGVAAEQVYLETGLYGSNPKKQLEEFGVRPGQVAIFARGVERGPTQGTFQGSYLDNALGCFAVLEAAKRLTQLPSVWEREMSNIRVLFTIATHEEIGRIGSRIAVREFQPDIAIGVDVCHDYAAAPGIGDRRMPPIAMGEGCVLLEGTAHSYPLTSTARRIAHYEDIRVQHDLAGKDSGNDSMAGPVSATDAAVFSIGFPVRNMHTSSELAHDGDVLAGTKLLAEFLRTLGCEGWKPEVLKKMHSQHQLSNQRQAGAIEPWEQ